MASAAMNDFVAATLSSGPAAMGSMTSQMAASGLSDIVDDGHGHGARRFRHGVELNEIVAASGLRNRKNELVSQPQALPVDRGDIGRRGSDRDAEMSLDQMFAKCRRMGGAAAAAGDDKIRRVASAAGEQAPAAPLATRPCCRRTALGRFSNSMAIPLRHRPSIPGITLCCNGFGGGPRQLQRTVKRAHRRRMINRDSVSGETHGRMRRASPPTSASRSTPKATSAHGQGIDVRCGLPASARSRPHRRVPHARPPAARERPKSRGDALAVQRTMACGSRLKLFEDGCQQDGRCYSSVMGPQHAPQRFLAEPCAAAFIGHNQAPAADTILAARELSPSNGAGAGHHHAAIAAAVRSDTSGLRIGRNHGAGERMLQPLGGRQVGRLAGACERQAGGDPPQVSGGRPACFRHSRVACRTAAKLASSPNRILAGPATASPSATPVGEHNRAAASGSAAINPEK